jgi:hypothetical protein
MTEPNLHIGAWVSFFFDHRALLGFIVNQVPDKRSFLIYVPSKKKHYTCPASMVVPEEPSVRKKDVQMLIDLALDLRDESWFRELIAK